LQTKKNDQPALAVGFTPWLPLTIGSPLLLAPCLTELAGQLEDWPPLSVSPSTCCALVGWTPVRANWVPWLLTGSLHVSRSSWLPFGDLTLALFHCLVRCLVLDPGRSRAFRGKFWEFQNLVYGLLNSIFFPKNLYTKFVGLTTFHNFFQI